MKTINLTKTCITFLFFLIVSCNNEANKTNSNDSVNSDSLIQGPLRTDGVVNNKYDTIILQEELVAKDTISSLKIQTTENAIDLLGRGYVTTFDRFREPVFETSFKKFDEKEIVMEGIHITTSQDYLKIMNKKASGSVSGYLGKASGGASSSYSIKTSTDEEIFAAVVSVSKNRYVMDKYRLTKEAKDILKTKPNDFEGVYGSSVVSEVSTGAECWIVFKLKAKTTEELQKLKQKAKASSGLFNASASGSFSRTLHEISSSSMESYSVIVRGVNEIPKNDNIDSALAYFFRFHKIAEKSANQVIISSKFSNFTNIPILNKYNIKNIINYHEEDSMNDAIASALNMLVEANGWVEDIKMVLDKKNAKLYNDATKKQAEADFAKANQIIGNLETFINNIRMREVISDPSMLAKLEFDRPFYTQIKKPSKPAKRVTKDDGNIAGDRGGAMK